MIGDVLAQGGLADVTGVSKGKGFQGVMRRHGFSGQGAAHGNHKKHRAPGSIGACATPARVFKGTRMAGSDGQRSGDHPQPPDRRVDTERDLLLLRGAVPGANGIAGPGPRGGEGLMAPISKNIGAKKTSGETSAELEGPSVRLDG